MASNADAKSLEVRLELATEEDLPRLVELQFEAFANEPVERLFFGDNTPSNRGPVVEAHRRHMQTNPGLQIVKAVLCAENQSNSVLGVSLHTESSEGHDHPHQQQNSKANRIVGWCMWYLPNITLDTYEEQLPSPLRPLSTTAGFKADWIKDDPHRRTVAENLMATMSAQIQESVNGRLCAYVRYLTVDPAYQYQGIGQKLMQWGCDLLDREGVDAYIQATVPGMKVYPRYGFEVIGTVGGDMGDGTVCQFPGLWRTCKVPSST